MTSQSCKKVRQLLVDYSDGELPQADAQRVATHLAECSGCRSELHLLEHSLELARAVWCESADRAPARGDCPVDRRPRAIPAAAVLVACVAVLMVAVGTWFFLRVGPRTEVDQVELAGPVEPPRETEEPAAGPPAEDIDVGTMIARAGRAARLAAAAELLATQPGLERYREETEQYLAEAYRGTPAGDRAALKINPLPKKEPES